jgi:hypothetical protein
MLRTSVKQCLIFKYVGKIHFSHIYETQLRGNSHGFRDVHGSTCCLLK